MMSSRGLLIVFEGIDRCGKSTQANLLARRLAEEGYPVQSFAFPTRDSPTGKLLDDYLSKKQIVKSTEAIHLLFSANRWEFSQKFKALIKEGTTLVVDRYAFSGTAYSVGALKMDFEWCKNADRSLLTPDIVFYLDIKPEIAATRAEYGGEIYEKLDLQQRVYDVYKRFKNEPFWHTIDAGKEAKLIHQEIWKIFSELHGIITTNGSNIEENLWCMPSIEKETPIG